MKRTVIRIGDRIRCAREKLGISQYELASRTGLRAETISRIERNKSPGTLVSIHKLVPALGVTLDYLLTGKKGK